MSKNDNFITYDKNFFEIKFNDNLDSEFENILRNNPYTEQDKIDELFSHLVILDEIKKHRNIEEKNLITKNIDFSISYAENGKKITEYLSIPFGMGHFSKGIEHLIEIGRVELDKDGGQKKDKIINFLKEKCSALIKPPKITIEKLEKNGWDTLDRCAEILNTISTPELSHFIKGFLETGKESKNKLEEIHKEKMKDSNITSHKTDTKNNKNQEKIEDMKRKVEKIANQKKTNLNPQEKEINNYKNLGMAR